MSTEPTTTTIHDKTLQQRFDEFHAANPFVYRLLVALAREAKRSGAKKIGAKALWERMRWELGVSPAGDGKFRLNNSLVALYARRIVEREPDLADMFELRARRAA